MLVAYISVTALTGHNLQEIIQLAPPGEPLTISAGITIVVGGAIVASLMTPDLTRYSKNGKHVLGVTIFTIIAGEFVVNGPAILIAKTPAPPMWSPSCRKRPAVPVCWSWCSPPCASTISTCIPLRWASSTRWKASPAKAEVHLHHTGDRDSGHHAVGAGHSGPLCRLPDGAWRSLPADYRHHAGGLLSAAQPPQNRTRAAARASCQTKRQPLAGRRSSPASPVAPLVWRPNGAYRPSTLWWPPACCIGCSNWPSAGRKTAGLTEVALIFAHELMHSSGNGECFMLEKGGRNGKNGPIARTNGHDS